MKVKKETEAQIKKKICDFINSIYGLYYVRSGLRHKGEADLEIKSFLESKFIKMEVKKNSTAYISPEQIEKSQNEKDYYIVSSYKQAKELIIKLLNNSKL